MRNKWWPLVAVCLSVFMLLVDVTIVNTALPEMGRSLHASFSALQWVVDIYALALAALLMVAGSLADAHGRRRVFLVGLAVFGLSSLACGLAPDEGTLIVARTVQGAGAAAMFATNAPLLTATYTGRDRGVAFGVWGAVSGAAVAAGLALGGALTEYAHWRAVFLVNLPLTALALLLTVRTVGESRAAWTSRVDWLGAALFTLFAAALTYGLISSGDRGWSEALTVWPLVAALVALVAFVAAQRGRAWPLLDLTLFRKQSFSVLMTSALLLNAAAFAQFTFIMLWLQSVMGLSPVESGLAALPMAGTSFVVSAVSGRLMHRVPPQRPLGLGTVLIGAGVLLEMQVTADSSWTALLAGSAVTGAGVGLALPVLISAALAAVPHERAGMASGAVSTFRQLGFAIGIAVLGTLFSSRVRDVLSSHGVPAQAAEAARSGRAAESGVPLGLVREAFAAGLDRIFLVAGITGVVTGLAVLLCVRGEDAQPTDTAGRVGEGTGPDGQVARTARAEGTRAQQTRAD